MIRYFRKIWIFVIIGSLLIIISTFIFGVVTFRYEQKLIQVQENIEELKNKEAESRYYFDIANEQLRISVLHNSILKSGFNTNKEQTKVIRNLYIKNLMSVFWRLFLATGQSEMKLHEVDEIKKIEKNATEGDNSALQKLNSYMLGFTQQNTKYRDNLVIKMKKLRTSEAGLKRNIIIWRNMALVFQILGLLLILLKEVPPKPNNLSKNES